MPSDQTQLALHAHAAPHCLLPCLSLPCSLVGTALHRQDRRSASSYLGTGLYLAIGTGGALATLLSLGSAWLVPALGVQDVEVALAATDYLRLRALGLPAVLSTMVLQSSE